MLEHILNSRQRVRILQLLIKGQDWIFSESDIWRELKEPKATIHRQIKSLVESGILISYKKGKSKVYRLNKKNHIVDGLLEPLFKKEDKIMLGVAESFCKKIKWAEVCVVFGSASKGTMKPTSDIDIALVADKPANTKLLEDLKAEFLETKGVIFSTHLFKAGDFRKRYKRKDPYILEIANGVVISGDLEKII